MLIIAESLILIFLEDFISSGVWWSIALVSVVGLLIFILVYSTWLQPQNQDLVNFKVSLKTKPHHFQFIHVNWAPRCEAKSEHATWLHIGLHLCGTAVPTNVEGNVCNNSFEFWSTCVLQHLMICFSFWYRCLFFQSYLWSVSLLMFI